ncbi:MAG: C-GCAxxG-C-C family protein [Clostridia bacterium]|nr:C-GCAxxG-C-C family protein [Clostridia bacterium]
MTRGEKAEQSFREGYNCTQAVVLAFMDDMKADKETLLRVAHPFGGGMGRLRLTCGAVSGAVMCLGLFFPQLKKSELYAIVQEYCRRFEEKNGSIICGRLLSGAGIGVDCSPNAEARTEEYYKKRPCPLLIRDAAELLETLLKERGMLS